MQLKWPMCVIYSFIKVFLIGSVLFVCCSIVVTQKCTTNHPHNSIVKTSHCTCNKFSNSISIYMQYGQRSTLMHYINRSCQYGDLSLIRCFTNKATICDSFNTFLSYNCCRWNHDTKESKLMTGVHTLNIYIYIISKCINILFWPFSIFLCFI